MRSIFEINNLILRTMQNMHSPSFKNILPSPQNPTLKTVRSASNFCQLQHKIGNYIYNTGRQLGSGYSSKVYLARKINTTDQYAVKVIELKKYSKSSMEMLENQIQLLRNLNHPNIIKCYDIYRSNEKCYIVTQYCPYGNLSNYLTKRGRTHQNTTIQIIQDIIEGCKYLFSLNILHRDLKLANILKGKNNWKICDFGFAIHTNSSLKANYNVGTPLYMPPQSLVSSIYSFKSDIFSIGIMLYELLVGRTPWEARTQKDLVKKMLTVPIAFPQSIQINEKLKITISKLCHIIVNERMGKQQFLQLQLKQKVQFQQKKQRIMSMYTIQKGSKSTQSQSTNEQLEASLQVITLKNIQILKAQLQYCKFLFNLTQNLNYLPFCCVDSCTVLKLVIFKHLLKIMKHLIDSNNNWFQLQEWNEFRKQSKYLTIVITLKQYLVKYEKAYIILLKNSQIQLIKYVNKEFNELSYCNNFTTKFYQKLYKYLTKIIIQTRNNLDQSISQQFSDKISLSIQQLKYVYKYYRLVQLSINYYENYSYFANNCSMKNYLNYPTSSFNNLNTYLNLKNQLKYI